jgi:hypothetical protein
MALGMSKQDVWKDIIQHPEYEDILKNSSRQEAEQLSPYIKALRIIRDLADSDDDDDQLAADILAAQYNIDVNNMQGLTASVQGQQQQQVEEPNLTPLLQGMERPNSAKQATQLQQTPQGGMTSE